MLYCHDEMAANLFQGGKKRVNEKIKVIMNIYLLNVVSLARSKKSPHLEGAVDFKYLSGVLRRKAVTARLESGVERRCGVMVSNPIPYITEAIFFSSEGGTLRDLLLERLPMLLREARCRPADESSCAPPSPRPLMVDLERPAQPPLTFSLACISCGSRTILVHAFVA